jgi:hypothetical protein
MKHLMLYEEWCSAGSLPQSAEPIFEIDMDWSTILHAAGDIAAAVGDVVVPGSGMVIDVINMLSYFVEASLKNPKTQLNDIIKLSLSGLIQFIAVFDPLNIVSTLKQGLNTIFAGARAAAPQATVAAARYAAEGVRRGILSLQNSALRIIGNVITTLSQSKFGQVISWLSGRLGITDVLGWLRRFVTQTLPGYIKTFLELLARLNPNAAGASGTSGEIRELIIKTAGKGALTNYGVSSGGDAIHSIVKNTANTFNPFYNSNGGFNINSYLTAGINTNFTGSGKAQGNLPWLAQPKSK